MYEQKWYTEGAHAKRFRITREFLLEHEPSPARILDLGIENPMGKIMAEMGHEVMNTAGRDFDYFPEEVAKDGFEIATAFEILEHMVSPLPVLAKIKAPVLYASVPLNLWFSKAYRGDLDPYDQHYHEFEDWQFDLLLEKSGWHITHSKKWAAGVFKPGIRPILRFFTDRYYLVRAERVSFPLSEG
jgi:hypothetical protein